MKFFSLSINRERKREIERILPENALQPLKQFNPRKESSNPFVSQPPPFIRMTTEKFLIEI